MLFVSCATTGETFSLWASPSCSSLIICRISVGSKSNNVLFSVLSFLGSRPDHRSTASICVTVVRLRHSARTGSVVHTKLFHSMTC